MRQNRMAMHSQVKGCHCRHNIVSWSVWLLFLVAMIHTTVWNLDHLALLSKHDSYHQNMLLSIIMVTNSTRTATRTIRTANTTSSSFSADLRARKEENSKENETTSPTNRPIIYTYAEIPSSSFSYQHQLAFSWIKLFKRCWTRAGWKPVVLTNLTTTRENHTSALSHPQVVRRKWQAVAQMASQHVSSHKIIWYADWDVFPLQLETTRNATLAWVDQLERGLSNQSMLLLERVAPSLAVATPQTWIQVADHVEQSFQQQPPGGYWTDNLALQDLLWSTDTDKNTLSPIVRVQNHVLGLDRIPLQLASDWCRQRWLRRKYAVHVGPRHLPTWAQTDLYRHLFDDAAWILPHHGPYVAEHLLDYLQSHCGSNTTQQ